MLTRSRSSLAGDGVLFVERANELVLTGKVKSIGTEPERKRVLIGRFSQ